MSKFTHSSCSDEHGAVIVIRGIRDDRKGDEPNIGQTPNKLKAKNDQTTVTTHIASLGNIICVQCLFLLAKYARAKRLGRPGPKKALQSKHKSGKRDNVSNEHPNFESGVPIQEHS
jgi:hypothetical protein